MNDLRHQDSAPSGAADLRRDDACYDDAALMPPVDVIEDAGGITLQADLPGVPRDKLSLQVDAGHRAADVELYLKGSRSSTNADQTLSGNQRNG